MAKLQMVGAMATIEITQDEETHKWIAECVKHSESDARIVPPGCCDWNMSFASIAGAIYTPYVDNHADHGGR